MRLEEEKRGDPVGLWLIKCEAKDGKMSVGPREAQSRVPHSKEKGQRLQEVTGSGGAGHRAGGSCCLLPKEPWNEPVVPATQSSEPKLALRAGTRAPAR